MILRRLARSLREQNWTAMAIEYMLPVVGVHSGIQAANGKDARREPAPVVPWRQRIVAEVNQNMRAGPPTMNP